MASTFCKFRAPTGVGVDRAVSVAVKVGGVLTNARYLIAAVKSPVVDDIFSSQFAIEIVNLAVRTAL